VGRPQWAFFDPVSEPPRLVGSWTWHDHTTAGSRRVVSTDVNGYATTAWRDGLDRTWKRALPDGNLEAWGFDSAGRLAAYTDPNGQQSWYSYLPTGERAAAPDATTGATRSWSYDGAGRMTEAVDRDGVATEYRWTWSGHAAGVDRAGWEIAAWSRQDDGLVTQAREGGVTTDYTYDALGRKETACVGPSDVDCALSLEWSWTANDRLLTESRSSASDPALTTTFTRNALGWLTTVEHPDGHTEGYGYDIVGRTRWHRDESARFSTWTWDDWGRPLTEDLPTQGTRSYSYVFGAGGSPEVHTTFEPDGGEWITEYDFAGRAVSERYPDGTSRARVFDGTRLAETWHLDAGGNQLAVEAYGYDDLGRVATRWGPVEAGVYSPGGWGPTACWRRRRSSASPRTPTRTTRPRAIRASRPRRRATASRAARPRTRGIGGCGCRARWRRRGASRW
jgi:YD repeat-containing protein